MSNQSQTKKEQILSLWSKGNSQTDIAEMIGISVHKVNTVCQTGKYDGIKFPKINAVAKDQGLTVKQLHSQILGKVENNPALLKILVAV